MKPGPLKLVFVEVFIKHVPLRDNLECLNRTFEKSHMKLGP